MKSTRGGEAASDVDLPPVGPTGPGIWGNDDAGFSMFDGPDGPALLAVADRSNSLRGSGRPRLVGLTTTPHRHKALNHRYAHLPDIITGTDTGSEDVPTAAHRRLRFG